MNAQKVVVSFVFGLATLLWGQPEAVACGPGMCERTICTNSDCTAWETHCISAGGDSCDAPDTLPIITGQKAVGSECPVGYVGVSHDKLRSACKRS